MRDKLDGGKNFTKGKTKAENGSGEKVAELTGQRVLAGTVSMRKDDQGATRREKRSSGRVLLEGGVWVV